MSTPNRISRQSLEDTISKVEYIRPDSNPKLTICVITMRNGYSVVGSKLELDPVFEDRNKDEEQAYTDALRQVIALESYILREYLADEEANRRTS